MSQFEYEGTDESAIATARRRIAEKDEAYRIQRLLDEDQTATKKPVRKAVKKVKVNPLAMSDEEFIAMPTAPVNQAAVRAAEPAVVPAPVPVPVPVDRSVAGLMQAGNTGMTYPSASSWIPDWMRRLFTPSVPNRSEWFDMDKYR